MRKETSGARLTPLTAYSMNRIDDNKNSETGISGTLGFNYEIRENDIKKFDFSIAQVVNEKENKKMSDKSSLNEKLSDLVGTSSVKINKNLNLNYDFSIDQNYKNINYNEVKASYNLNSLNIDFG